MTTTQLQASLMAAGTAAVIMWSGARVWAATVAPDNPNLVYAGRCTADDRFDWPGSGVRLRFNGTNLAVMLQNEGGFVSTSYYRLATVVDGVYHGEIVTTASGSNMYTIATGLSAGEHTVDVIKRNEEDWATPVTRFLGFVVNDGATVLPAAQSTRQVLCIGDSFTVGYGARFAGAPQSSSSHAQKMANDDTYNAYGMLVARQYGAEAHIIARSGIGVYCLNNTLDTNGSMRTRVRQTLFADGNMYYTWSNYVPAVITVALGINDFATWGKTGTPSRAQFEEAYHELLNTLTGAYPAAKIALLTFGTEPWHAYVTNVAKLRGCWYTNVVLSTSELGLDWHPNLAGHTKIAGYVAGLIDTMGLGWTSSATNYAVRVLGAPLTMMPGSNYTVSVRYTAPVPRVLVANLLKSDNYAWAGGASSNVPAGVDMEVDLPLNVLGSAATGQPHHLNVYLSNTATNWQGANASENVHVTVLTGYTTNVIRGVPWRETQLMTQPLRFTVSYAASDTRALHVDVFASDNSTWLAYDEISVPAGAGATNLFVTLPSPSPGQYWMHAYIAPVGTNWQGALHFSAEEAVTLVVPEPGLAAGLLLAAGAGAWRIRNWQR